MSTSQQPEQSLPTFTIGDRLGKALRHGGVSAQEMADYLDVHRNTISAYINERQPVRGGTLRLWAMRTGVPLEWLENGDDGTAAPAPTPPNGGGGLSIDNEAIDRLAAAKRARSGSRRDNRQYDDAA